MLSAAPDVATISPPTTDLDDVRLLLRRGLVRQALALLATVQQDRDALHLTPIEQVAVTVLGLECHLAQGDLTPAAALGQQLAVVVGEGSAMALCARGELTSALGAPETAADLFLAAGQIGADDVRPILAWRSGAALALLRIGRRREALELAHAHLAFVQVHGTVDDVAHALRTLATTEPDGQRQNRLLAARALLTFSESERLQAQIDTDLAGLMLLDGKVEEAIALLRTVEVFAGRQDLWPLQSRVRRLLERMGEDPRRLEAEALAVLTAAERRVALLALDGLTNREIATQLAVSVKAVEGHLSKVYRKLGISSRGALTAIVSRRD